MSSAFVLMCRITPFSVWFLKWLTVLVHVCTGTDVIKTVVEFVSSLESCWSKLNFITAFTTL